jgi:hypothetical protein
MKNMKDEKCAEPLVIRPSGAVDAQKICTCAAARSRKMRPISAMLAPYSSGLLD